jgi:hypothetical protein
MAARAGVEFMRDVLVEKLLVEITVYFKEEVLSATIDYYIEGFRLQQVGKVDYGIVLPVIRIFLYAS